MPLILTCLILVIGLELNVLSCIPTQKGFVCSEKHVCHKQRSAFSLEENDLST